MLDPLEQQVQLDRVAVLLAQSERQDLRDLLDRLGQQGPRGRRARRVLRELLVQLAIQDQV